MVSCLSCHESNLLGASFRSGHKNVQPVTTSTSETWHSAECKDKFHDGEALLTFASTPPRRLGGGLGLKRSSVTKFIAEEQRHGEACIPGASGATCRGVSSGPLQRLSPKMPASMQLNLKRRSVQTFLMEEALASPPTGPRSRSRPTSTPAVSRSVSCAVAPAPPASPAPGADNRKRSLAERFRSFTREASDAGACRTSVAPAPLQAWSAMALDCGDHSTNAAINR